MLRGLLLLGSLLVVLYLIYNELLSPDSQVKCPSDTCDYDHSDNEYIIDYTTELNENSPCNDIKEYIIDELEKINPNTFSLSTGDNTTITKYDSRIKELIYVMENSSNLVKFKLCCQSEDHCLL